MSNTIELREINKLINMSFHIPTYQRGYRWDERQVKDLLDDLYEFKSSANTNVGEFYCLQPIVVKKNDEQYEVIDGQQRLTTIYIILKYLKMRRLFSIDYATREGSKAFLESIEEHLDDEESDTNIDFYFMRIAYTTVRDWFERKVEENEEYSLETEMTTYFLRHCQVIWYEVDDNADVESIFTRLNIGKIPLTNAELIKALLLRSSNYSEEGTEDDKINYLRRLEIANEWDQIENTLQDDKVWFFINPKKQTEVRIEYLFDIAYLLERSSDEYAAFHETYRKLDLMNVEQVWQEIKDRFQLIMEWYHDQILYHLIGFLASSDQMQTMVSDLIFDYNTYKYTKSEFKKEVMQRVKNRIKKITNIGELDYDTDDKEITTILLLFNVVTVMRKSNAYSRFPFDRYKKNQWTLEHIHAQQAEGILNSEETMLAWLDDHLQSFRTFIGSDASDERNIRYQDVVKKLEEFDRKSITREKFSVLFEEISEIIESDYGIDLNNISNLALLERGINTSLSNSFFDVKRTKIVEKDRNGEFIPICTRNVFLKYYSEDASQIHYWNQADRDDYLQAIKSELSDFLPQEDE